MSTFRVLAAAALALPLAACGSPLDNTCVDQSVVVEMPATASVGPGQFTQPLVLAGTLAEDNVDPAVFTRIRRIAADAEEGSGAFVFTMEPRGSSGVGAEFLSIALRLPLRDGDVVDVSTAFQGGGWGLVTLAANEDAAASLRVAGAYARSFAGTVTVLEASPLRLRMDLRATAAGGETLRVRGDAAFALAEDRAPCS